MDKAAGSGEGDTEVPNEDIGAGGYLIEDDLFGLL